MFEKATLEQNGAFLGIPQCPQKSYIKDTNEFLKKLCSLPKLLDGIILCTMDVAGLYPNIPHGEGLSALRKKLETPKEKCASTDTTIDLADL